MLTLLSLVVPLKSFRIPPILLIIIQAEILQIIVQLHQIPPNRMELLIGLTGVLIAVIFQHLNKLPQLFIIIIQVLSLKDKQELSIFKV